MTKEDRDRTDGDIEGEVSSELEHGESSKTVEEEVIQEGQERVVEAEDTSADETPDETEKMRQEIDQLRAEADQWLDKYRRSVADFSNYRKRQDRAREQETSRITMSVLRRLLPIVDDFDRALKDGSSESAESCWKEGILLIRRKLRSLLQDYQVVPMEALGKPFDPKHHSALIRGESDEYPEGTVMEELQRGYLVAGQVLRPALVGVSTGPKTADEAAPESREDESQENECVSNSKKDDSRTEESTHQ